MKKTLILSLIITILFTATGCGDHDKQNSKVLDISKVDKLSYAIGNDEVFTTNKDIIAKIFSEDSIYTEQKDYNQVYYGCSIFHIYNGKKLQYEICVHGDGEYVRINDIWYSVENPPDYQEISHLIQEEDMKKNSDNKAEAKALNFKEVDRLSVKDGDKEIFTDDKDIINKMFPKDAVYTEENVPEYYGQSTFYAYNGNQLLYEVIYPTYEYVCINGTWYSVENPPDYSEISHMIQEQNKD